MGGTCQLHNVDYNLFITLAAAFAAVGMQLISNTMSPAEYLSSLTYKHPWAATAQAVALDMWWHHTDCRKEPTGHREKLRT